uniref:Ribonuclease Y n=1 Tax=Magnetococcus massalia (strain MO-1) TaxID=451514 RepID=A0A1S7LPT6_MAGMO|nr:2',3'-cyclic-nucleotide 2'-phosphodiesterase [Candidatus Magnetococcus massalia]
MEIVLLILGLAIGGAGTFFFIKGQSKQALEEKQARIELLSRTADEHAKNAAKEIEITVKSESLRIKEEIENELKARRDEVDSALKRLDKREEQLDRKTHQLDNREEDQNRRRDEMDKEKSRLESKIDDYEGLKVEAQKKLESIAMLSREEAKQQLIDELEELARNESARQLKAVEEDLKAQSQKKAQEVISSAIQRFSGEFVVDRTVSVVALPTDEMKGRIIGREGRNIRALEAATGCDLIIDDTPEAVVVSGFNPVRRQVARRALEELVTDGRIHPARIEEVVRKARKVVNQEIREAGEQAAFDVGITNMHPEIMKLLGTLKFRTSYTQNVLAHSVEVAHFAGIMAEEMGLDGKIARRCGLLHDIGKAVDHDSPGSHAVLGGELCKKYKEHPLVTNAVWSHHFDIEPSSVYGPLTNAADALSAARPGARRENVETYVKRLEELERIATGFKGVDKAYAIQAGRELRVVVSYDRVNDEGSMVLARQIADQVENEMTYPGEIKVTVIREMRATEVAH